MAELSRSDGGLSFVLMVSESTRWASRGRVEEEGRRLG